MIFLLVWLLFFLSFSLLLFFSLSLSLSLSWSLIFFPSLLFRIDFFIIVGSFVCLCMEADAGAHPILQYLIVVRPIKLFRCTCHYSLCCTLLLHTVVCYKFVGGSFHGLKYPRNITHEITILNKRKR